MGALLGRDHGQDVIAQLLDEVRDRGAALVVHGEAGVWEARVARGGRGHGGRPCYACASHHGRAVGDEPAVRGLAPAVAPRAGLRARSGETLLPPYLVLTAQLEHAFAARMGELPAATRVPLLVAAAEDSAGLEEIIAAAGS